jgi:pyruvate formate lyase activating enzyme
MHQASFYDRLEDGKVHCRLCRHHCRIEEGRKGICGVRVNRDGELYTLVYGMPCSTHVDPIEKKPLFHFFPGSKAFSIATVGCNFRCRHCQNHEISQMPRDAQCVMGDRMEPPEVVQMAAKAGCKSISYTYTEPTMFYEYAFDIAKLAKEQGIFNNFVTNGYIEEEPLRAIGPWLSAANIDLKGFSEEFYRKVCFAELSQVMETIKVYKALGIWIELTTLVIPGYNDKEEELRGIARFIRNDLGPEVPWHVSAFYPTYKLLDAPRTPPGTLAGARRIGLDEGLRYVYVGNVPGLEGEHTYCYACKRAVIERFGYAIGGYHIHEGSCSFCGAPIDGVGL